MQRDFLVLVLISAAIGILFLGLLFAFLLGKSKTPKKAEKIPSAREVLEALGQGSKTLEDLGECVGLAKAHYCDYMEEIADFDVQFVVLLAAHKAVSAKLLLEVESYFKSMDSSRKEILSKALGAGVARR